MIKINRNYLFCRHTAGSFHCLVFPVKTIPAFPECTSKNRECIEGQDGAIPRTIQQCICVNGGLIIYGNFLKQEHDHSSNGKLIYRFHQTVHKDIVIPYPALVRHFPIRFYKTFFCIFINRLASNI